MHNQIEKPAGLSHPASTYQTKPRQKDYTKTEHQNKVFDRGLLPTPANFYSKEFPGLKIKSTWVKVICPFYQDDKTSLHISMIGGYFKCNVCDVRGCDVLVFQRLLYNKTFQEAVTVLNAWRIM